MAWRQILFKGSPISQPLSPTGFARFFSKPSPYAVKVGIPEFLNGIGKGVESHAAKLETEVGLPETACHSDAQAEETWHPLQTGLVFFFISLSKKKELKRKLILTHAHKYRLGLWRPRAVPMKS
ncbi:hypothetical protein FEM48_Zijuj06G0022700 [Ziziphus jujuba var. spinosa]|uniref:Uncharacterized protein n=1 Tax=Ziziphus jujuba var. spinosa TaxID=714518 RepID=A0A978V6K6_ZIZJJ|nr:hypothetical protein FEM48_Zijuj06G0022700 [Ziziphus jujuba var. spinosa]